MLRIITFMDGLYFKVSMREQIVCTESFTFSTDWV